MSQGSFIDPFKVELTKLRSAAQHVKSNPVSSAASKVLPNACGSSRTGLFGKLAAAVAFVGIGYYAGIKHQ
jgi:hypothetical protein